jgi:hypothetical protein
MEQIYNWKWVEAQVSETIGVWNGSPVLTTPHGPQYCPKEQQKRESAYDGELLAVEREAKKTLRSKVERLKSQDRIVASLVRFSASSLDLEEGAVKILTNDFLPAGTKLARWARRFDKSLSIADITQACRNAWIACGLQSLLGDHVGITPAILGYSLLYPYTDNFLDCEDVSSGMKLLFSERFRSRLRGEKLSARNDREAAVWTLVSLIEKQYPRESHPQIFSSLLAIHQAQEESIAQTGDCGHSDMDLLRISCAKGGSSVLVDACLSHGMLNEVESRFSFELGVLLQLCDDLQDVGADLQCGAVTLFSRAVRLGAPLDTLVSQLLGFSERVGSRMEHLPNASDTLKELLRMSWRSLIIGAVAESHECFSPDFIRKMECCSPFRFEFLRTRHERLTRRQRGLYTNFFDIFLESDESHDCELPVPENGQPRYYLEFQAEDKRQKPSAVRI